MLASIKSKQSAKYEKSEWHYYDVFLLSCSSYYLGKIVGSQFSDFSNLRKFFEYMVVHQLDACTYCPDGLKTKNQNRIGLGELVVAQPVTLSYSPKFRLQMGINRSCI